MTQEIQFPDTVMRVFVNDIFLLTFFPDSATEDTIQLITPVEYLSHYGFMKVFKISSDIKIATGEVADPSKIDDPENDIFLHYEKMLLDKLWRESEGFLFQFVAEKFNVAMA